MELFIKLMPLIAGIYLVFMAIIMETENFISSLAFKVLPMFIGLGCLFSALKLFRWM